jgi:hypothetical protein
VERISRRTVPACPTLFTPLQIHARELLRFGTVSWVGWMRDHTISLQRMIEEHSSAVVVAGASLTYKAKRLFHDGDTIEIDTTSTVHRKGMLIEGTSRFLSLGKEFASMKIYFRPVAIGDENSAAARPSNLKPELKALFSEKEIHPESYPRRVKDLLPEITSDGVQLAARKHPFKLYRYAMDFADQWAFMESSAFASASREAMAQEDAGLHERLLDGLTQPVEEFHVDLQKPYFVLDHGIVDTTAHLYDGSVYFVHRLLSGEDDAQSLHAIVIEKMAKTLQ